MQTLTDMMKRKDAELQQQSLEQKEKEGECASNSVYFMDVHDGSVIHAMNSILDYIQHKMQMSCKQ